MSIDSFTFNGYHGTDRTNLNPILKNGFDPSLGDEEWIGDGVYFFTEGIPDDPAIDAEKWAIAEAWDNVLSRNKYSNWVVIYSLITVTEDNFLDLTTDDGLKSFNYLRDRYIDKIKSAGLKLQRGVCFKDGHIINDARKINSFRIDVVKANFYIKFAKERILNFNVRTPNTTIIAVSNNKCFIEGSIKKIKEGVIK